MADIPNKAGKTVMDYIVPAAEKLGLIGRPKDEPVAEQLPAENRTKAIGEKDIEKASSILRKYKDGKSNLESRIVEEERWWKLRHWDIIRGNSSNSGAEARPEPTSAWLFNSLSNKHSDLMDNIPEPNVLPREQMDEADADTLSSILPVVFERNNYEQTYSDAAWYKLKHGVCAKGVFWNNDLEDGLGDIDVHTLDILNIFWEPGIRDIQASRNLFIVTLRDNDLLMEEYPQLTKKGIGSKVIDVKEYVYDDKVDTTDKSLVVDWYYKKKTPEGKTVLHLCKFVGNEILFASENDPAYADGFYAHGKYPVVFDVLFPEEGTPVGFGYISIMKSPQLYIDKLSQVLLENSMMAARPRYFAKKGNGINMDDFTDWSKSIVEYSGELEALQPVQVQQVGAQAQNILQMKIDELKETSSNRDVSQGSSSGGVTAAAAIAALQEAGNKTSRDMIAASYRSYTNECYLAIELIRQFYSEDRTFRITGQTGQNEYITFSNANIQPQPIPVAYAGQELEPDYVESKRVPIFDVVVKPQKKAPFSRMAQNELAKEVYQMGLFNPELADQALAVLDMMEFEGIEKVRDRIEQNQTLYEQVQMLSQQLAQFTGMLMPIQQGMPTPQPQGNSIGRAQKEAQMGSMTDYGRRLAENAVPDMNQQELPM